MTDATSPGHSPAMGAMVPADGHLSFRSAEPAPRACAGELRVADVYDAHGDFVWRSARRLGVADASLDDVVQDVFLVVHRRRRDFAGRSSVRTWLFGITLRVVRDHRRTLRRKGGLAPLTEEAVAGPEGRGPSAQAERNDAVRLLHRLLGSLDDDKRAVFILAELEQMSAPEIAEALELNVNTVYSRLRAARRLFEAALARHRAEEARRCR
ncbi:MAG: RNA polymerase sigma factor [Sandaracinaceae bacterium]